MIYSMFFEEKINPYTGQPYVTNPRLSPNNIYTAQYILDNWEFKYGILYDLPTKVPGEYETVELMIKFPFNLRYRHWTDRLFVFLRIDFYEGDQLFDDVGIPDEYIPYYFMIWIASYHDYHNGMHAYENGTHAHARREHFSQISKEFLQEIQNRPIVDGKPAEHSQLDQDKFLRLFLRLGDKATPWLQHVQTNDDALRLIYGYTGSFSEKMKRWCAHS
jgi:hypothetical protein